VAEDATTPPTRPPKGRAGRIETCAVYDPRRPTLSSGQPPSGRQAYFDPEREQRDIADVPDAILTATQWQFYDSPTRSEIIAMGLA
jgi:hypothetical protein